MKKIFTLLLLSLVAVAGFSQSTTVTISQVYAGGGTSTAGVTYKYDYVELHNISNVTQSLTGYSLQYGSATGNLGSSSTQIYGIQAGTTIPAGGYLLIQMGAAGGAGADLPVTPDYISANVNLGGTSGKIALANVQTGLACGATATPCSLPSVNIIDLVAWGTSNNGEGGVTVGTVSISTGAVRKQNGCQDTDNNATDFDIVSNPVPRNASTPVNICGALGPILSATPNITNITTTVGVASAPQSYNLSGTNLTGFPGNITVTAPAGLEVSLSSGAGFGSGVLVPYASATLANTPIYVRIAASAPQGAVSASISNAGGGASTVNLSVSGAVYQNFYNTKANLGLNNTGTWSSTLNGSGASPVDFTTPYQLFNIVNQANANYTGDWNVAASGNTARIVVGDGTSPLTFTIKPDTDSLTSATRVDVLNNGTLVIQNNRRPFLNNLATGSTVNFAQTGITATDTIRIPAISYYNLTLTGGLKYLSGGTTTVRGNFLADGVYRMNGSSPTFSTLNLFGNATFANETVFDNFPDAPADAARITLAMNGTGRQSINEVNNNSKYIFLFRLQRDSINTSDTITLNAGLYLGNHAGGGLRLNQGAATNTILDIEDFAFLALWRGAASTPTANGRITSSSGGGSILINRSDAGSSALGQFNFVPGSSFNTLNMNCYAPFETDSMMLNGNIFVTDNLFLNGGRLVCMNGTIIETPASCNVDPGSVFSFIDGKLRRALTTGGDFPVGNGDVFAPVHIDPTGAANDYSVQYFKSGYGNYTIDPATLGSYPGYEVSKKEYWTIDRVAGLSANIIFYYTSGSSGILTPGQVKVAHFDGTDWNDLGGTADPGNTTTAGFVTVTGVTTFSPFTFSARVGGVIPVRMSSFNVLKMNRSVKVYWTTEQEINSKTFIVERSANGYNWTAIATVPAAGNSNNRINYSFNDEYPLTGINYYRIRQVDLDNRSDYSITKSVLFRINAETLVTPNPAGSIIHVYADNVSKQMNIQLVDITGKIVLNQDTTEQHSIINTSSLARGIYYLRITDGDNVKTSKIILQ
ncbi:MAG: T9SS type A sorting domain-containing protein [Bacteroidetes bacterium]|nr:T9SS type A sorting domain-containing protein [Bacteroidota bacterium]